MSEQIVVIDATSWLMPRVFALRHDVFVLEQSVPVELEIDEYDAGAAHLVALRGGGRVVGTLRIVDADRAAKVGRLAVQADERRNGIGRHLMQRAEAHARENGFREIVLGAQLAATEFYLRLGYTTEGDVFDDAGIPHISMRKKLL
jgi:predicted GNAT family N-acyltransferase